MKVLSLYNNETKLNILVNFWLSDNPSYTENCDSVIGYDVYNKNNELIDGGEMDFNSNNYSNDLSLEEDNILINDFFNYIASDYKANYFKLIEVEDTLFD